jgi:rod shape determining protein RodA
MIAVLAAFLASRRDRIRNFSTVLGAGLLVAPPLALVLVQPDLGTSLVFGAVLAGMLFMTGTRLRWLLAGAAVVLAALPVIWLEVLKDYQRRRLISFLDPSADAQGSGYQVVQSQIAVGSGGLFGKGLTNGGQSGQGFLPEQTTDFAAAVLLEELGFVGGAVLLLLFAALIWRVLLIGWRSDHLFGIAFASGVASLILFQLLVNVGMVLGMMPVTGIPLPFVTHGGASLISLALGLGILQSINMRRYNPGWE